MSETDQALVIRSQRGDRAAFEQLVRSTARLVFSRLYLETGDAHRAEDLSQETFLVAWRSIGQVIDPSGFRTWLLSVARTVHLDAVRREMRKKRFAPREPAERLSLLERPGKPGGVGDGGRVAIAGARRSALRVPERLPAALHAAVHRRGRLPHH